MAEHDYYIQYRRPGAHSWNYYGQQYCYAISRVATLEEELAGGSDSSCWGRYLPLPRDYVMECRDNDENLLWRLEPTDTHYTARLTAEGVDCTRQEPTPASHNPPLPPGEIRHMIKVGIARIEGKLKLLINAKEFHDQLNEIGCTYSESTYNDAPAVAYQVASASFQMSPLCLLKRDYREVEVPVRKDGVNTMEKRPVTATYDLAGIWGNPPSLENLKKLCNSADVAARKILEHYQPIDIAVEIHKKVVK